MIDESQAWIVRRIYREFLDGKTFGQIGYGLTQEGILSNRGTTSWAAVNVRYILENEKYAGHALLQKYHKKDVLASRCGFNDGSAPQYLAENCHTPIIPQIVFNLVQEKLARMDEERSKGLARKTRNNSGLFGIIHCEEKSVTFQYIGATDSWHCYRGSAKTCHVRTVKGDEARRSVLKAIHDLVSRRDEMVALLEENSVTEQELAGFVELKVGQEWETSGVGERLLRRHYVRSLFQLLGEEIESGDEGVDEFYRKTAPKIPTEETDAVESLIMRFVESIIVKKDGGLKIEFRAGVSVGQ